MLRNPVTLWIVLSFSILLIGSIWKYVSPNENAFVVYFIGWVSTLLAVGYYSTPSGSWYGKVAFGSVVVMVAGTAFKILHYPGANELIIVGLSGLVVTYSVRWIKEKKFL